MKKGGIIPDKVIPGLLFLLRGHRTVFSTAVVFLLVNVSCSMLINLVIKSYTDTVMLRTQAAYPVQFFLLTFLVLAVSQAVTAFFGGKLTSRYSESIVRELRQRLFDHIQALSFSYHDRMQTGELIQRVTSDVASINRFYGMQAIQIIRIMFMFIVNWGMILYLNIRLGLISIILIPFIALLSVVFFVRISRAFRTYQNQDARMSTTVQENLSGVRVVKAFARQSFESYKFDEINNGLQGTGRKLTLSHALYWPVSHALCSFQTVGGLAFAGYLAYTGTISLGTFIAYAGMSSQIIWPLQNLGRVVADVSTACVSYTRIAEILNAEPEDMETGNSNHQCIKGAIQCSSLSFTYQDGQTALKNIDFNCKPGEKIALIGEPGSGKTSFINLLPRFYEISKGNLTLDGIDIRDYPKKYLREQIGIVEQQPFLFSASIRENIACGVNGPVDDALVYQAAERACISENIESFPHKYDTLVGEKGVTLSGGQKQRIAIARTILKDPALLILDDSTSAVDPETEDSIRDALDALMKGKTTFIIAHRISSVVTADQILVFREGRIIQRGTHSQLVKEEGFYRTVFSLQSRIEDELEKETHYV